MIAYVKGTIEEVTEDNVVLDNGGIGYNVKISARVSQSIPGFGQELKLFTYTLVRDDAFLLYGFLSKNDLDMFKKCITVNGIGPKGALSLLSVMDADSLKYAILSKDAKAIAKAPGIGMKTAERLILDLKDKVSYNDTMINKEIHLNHDGNSLHGENREAVEALVALGYGQAESLRAVSQIEDADGMDSGELLKAALKKLF
ncbi:MAG TPA: Holliday junction branch migration protein RuvA [Lachnospiraceae bacterium]|nr:Holliday junction branch migration protein RuvA [Lachnospiraceae bacterium]